MLNCLVRFFMFLTSYIPLYVILMVQYMNFDTNIKQQPFILILLILTFLSLLAFEFGLFILNKNKSYITCTNISKVEILKEVNSTYLLTYIMPLIAFDFSKTQDCISFLILFIAIMAMYIKYNMIFLNPVLEIFGYTYYSYENELGDKIVLISRSKFNNIHSWYKIKYVNLGQNMFLVVNAEMEND